MYPRRGRQTLIGTMKGEEGWTQADNCQEDCGLQGYGNAMEKENANVNVNCMARLNDDPNGDVGDQLLVLSLFTIQIIQSSSKQHCSLI